jgi:Domain of unknown function (DUF6265)
MGFAPIIRSGLAALAIILAALATTAAQAGCAIGDLHWLAGTWQSSEGDSVTEERWVVLPTGALIGSSWSVHTTRPGGVAEAETILGDGDEIQLRLRHFDPGLAHAREPQDGPMLFVASLCEADHVVFDGRGDKVGEHIAYRRDGDTYIFIGDFLPGGKPLHVEQSFTKGP